MLLDAIIFIVLFISISIIIIISWQLMQKAACEYADSHPKEWLTYYIDHMAEEKYICTLVLTIQGDAAFNGTIYDFSQYETNNIIALSVHHEASTPSDYRVLKRQTVYKMKNGDYLWDYRYLL